MLSGSPGWAEFWRRNPQLIGEILGGVGLFLLGMILMTDGLKSAAGDAMKTLLGKFTGSPIRGMFSGAALTALVQSSSATTLATIGFVSAGLLTFPTALGVILGINIGTTSTGWIVSLLGLKFKISAIALPLVGVGALMRLLGKGKIGAYGTALAGFGLIFVGIDVLQAGMSELATRIDPASFPQGPFFGRLILIFIGVVMTVVMQSSSAAVATTLTALHSEAITLPQAAALVIGQNVGTTVKAVLASIGGSVAVKRTAAAHIIFNLVTAVAAYALLPLFLMGIPLLFDVTDPGSAATAIALFHTGFNVLGVMIFLPILHPFARYVMKIVPEKSLIPRATRFLDPAVAATGSVGVEAARRALVRIERDFVIALDKSVSSPNDEVPGLSDIQEGLAATREFLSRVAATTKDQSESTWKTHLSVMHALDHLDRLAEAAAETQHARWISKKEELHNRLSTVTRTLRQGLEPLEEMIAEELPVPQFKEISLKTADWRRGKRIQLLEASASGDVMPEDTLAQLEAVRWIDRLAYHSWRALRHLSPIQESDAPKNQPREENGEKEEFPAN